MKKSMKKSLLALIAVVMTAVAVFSLSGCLFYGLPEQQNQEPDTIPADQLSAEDKAAMECLTTYFDAFAARDAEAMADSMCSDCRLRQLNQANGATRDNFVALMQSNLDNTDAEYGSDSQMKYDPESLAVTNADEYLDVLNEEFRIDTETEPVVDVARIVHATVWFVTGEGEEMEHETGSMLVYRYNNEWFIYGYAGI